MRRTRNRISKTDDAETIISKLKGQAAAAKRHGYGGRFKRIASIAIVMEVWERMERLYFNRRGAKILPDQGIVRKILSPAAFDVSKPNGARIRIKLYGVFFPNSAGAYWKEEAETELYQLAAHKRVRWEPVKTETSGRIIAIVWADMTPGAISINAEMVRAGLLVVDEAKRANREICNRWRILQQTAEIKRMGIHANE